MNLEKIENAVLIWGPIFDQNVEELTGIGNIFVVPENRPFMLGLKYNCPRLRRIGVSFFYCPDNALGLLFAKGKIYKTLIFAKKTEDKKIVGVSGSLYAALLSKLHGVGIKIFTGDMSNIDFSYDARHLGGKIFLAQEGSDRYVVAPSDEVIEEGILNET